MRTLLILMICSISLFRTSAQIKFQKTYGTESADYASDIIQTNDGNYVLCGFIETDTTTDAALVKIDINGDTLWTKIISGTDYETFAKIRECANGGFIISGSFYDQTFGDAINLVRTDANGNVQWTHSYEGGYDFSVYQTSDLGFICCGQSSFGLSSADLSVIRTDSNGTLKWIKYYDIGGANEEGYNIIETAGGDFIIGGLTAPNNYYAFLFKINSVGNPIWNKFYNATASTYLGNSMQPTNDGGYVIAGSRYSSPSKYPLLIKTTSSGTVQWTKDFDFNGLFLDIYSVVQTTDSGFLLSCIYYNSITSMNNPVLLKTDQGGNFTWAKVYFGSSSGYIHPTAIQTNDGGFIMSSIVDSIGAGRSDFYIIKTDSAGNSGCNDSALNAVSSSHNTITSSFVTGINIGTLDTIPLISVRHGGAVNDACLQSSVENYLPANNKTTVFPNPVSEIAAVRFFLLKEQSISVRIINQYGCMIELITHVKFPEGMHEIPWDSNNFSSGTYILQIEMENKVENIRTVVIK